MTRLNSGACAILALLALTVGANARAETQAGRRVDVLDANIVSEQQLLSLPNVTPALAKGIVQRRPFLTMTDFDTFLGQSLTKERRTELYRRLFVQINLNTASDAEILLIPGVGPRMLHEFREYRPYRALAQFRREIGKYVDDKELARLEQYVFVPTERE